MKESFRSRLTRWGFNHFPPYRRTGARITHIAADFGEVRIKLPLNWKTRNYVGTIFGASMFGAIDGIHLVMLLKLLGPGYIVWDKAAAIRYKRPGRTTLYARILLDEQQLESIRAELTESPKLDRVLQVDLTDEAGNVHATIERTIHVRRKDAMSSSASWWISGPPGARPVASSLPRSSGWPTSSRAQPEWARSMSTSSSP